MLLLTKKGLYCSDGDFYIDPWEPVDKAIITHSHSDHARFGHKKYLCHKLSADILKARIGEDLSIQTVEYNETLSINSSKISFHPAGHIIGSSQIRIEKDGEIWVVSGDYKLENDGISTPFEPVKCHHFITESTFAMPVYKWEPQSEIFSSINNWWKQNALEGKCSVIFGYSLGKAQRILANIDASIGKIFLHGAVANLQEVFIKSGFKFPPTYLVSDAEKSDFKTSLVVAPPSAYGTPWLKKFTPFSTAIASGWMQVRGSKRRRAVDRGFVLSDHADWPGLLKAVAATGAENVYATHGYRSVFARYLREQGLNGVELETLWEGEGEL